MRYTGGLLGGSWLTTLIGDLGHGKFDGTWLVQNFENQNPSNTLWTKQYNLYSKIDTEAPRYLGFETWWGGHVNLNAEEMQFIVDELFVGNNLAAGRIRTSNGTSIDLRNIRSPIVVFCSQGDNITPPQQALGWILDVYDSVEEIRSYGQTIVYTVHDTIGHLGIFVSGKVARKEHGEFSSNIDMIDILPPGLYEAVIEAKTEETEGSAFVTGEWVMRCEARTLDDIRALGGNDAADDRRFAAAARVSEMNLALYRTFMQPLIRQSISEPVASLMKQCHPLRLQYSALGDNNPMMGLVKVAADQVRDNRKPAEPDNPFIAFQDAISQQIVGALDSWRDMTEAVAESTFHWIYGSPVLQAALGIDPADEQLHRKAGKSSAHRALLQARIDELKSRIATGGLRECLARGLLYVGMARGGPDERGLAAFRRLRAVEDDQPRLTLSEFKSLIREQYYMLLIDQAATLAAIPRLLPTDQETRRGAFAVLCHVLNARGDVTGEAADRLRQMAQLFGVEADPSMKAESKSDRKARA
jgi:Protein of unknown function (DUF3141)